MESTPFGLTINVPSVDQIIHDLIDCIGSSGQKVTKRLNRLKAIFMMQGKTQAAIDRIVASLKIAPELNTDTSADAIMTLAASSEPEQVTHIEFGANSPDDGPKKAIEAALTQKMNATMYPYGITCGIALRIWKRITRHTIFAPMVRTRDMIFMHKGSVAQRLVLMKHFPQHVNIIDKWFALGGDNDCNILINPKCPNFDRVYMLLTDYVYHCMVEFAGTLSHGNINTLAKAITEIDVNGLIIKVSPTERNNFQIHPHGDISCMDVEIAREPVYTTRNDSLDFTDDIGRRSKFSLIRYKKAFKTESGRVFGAELLDIAIPHMHEDKIKEHFSEYQSGEWIDTVNI